jgi:murein DD-endopeptidase MepM/ murein hydrolase activator NlpD
MPLTPYGVKNPDLMHFLSLIQSRLVALLVGILFLCTTVLGAVLLAAHHLLSWIDRPQPHLHNIGQRIVSGLHRHPKTISAVLASFLLAGGGGAFAIANLAPDIADQPVVNITVPIEIAQLEAQADSLDLVDLQLTRSDFTRAADTPDHLLRRLGLADAQAAAFLRQNPLARQALQQSGRSVTADANAQQQLRSLSVRWLKNETDTFFHRLVVTRTERGFEAALQTSPMTTSVRMTGGTVTRSLYDAADETRLPDPVITQLTQIFSNQIDFHRTLRKGARFSVVYEVLEADGEPIRTGRVLSAEFNNDNKTYEAVWFQEPGQKGNYYDMDGKSLSRAYLASPVQFSRQTSGFAVRLHPIFNTRKAHLGVDYAAPTGTPALTVGDGVVSFAGRQGGYGNVVKVRHGNGHETLYAHLNKIHVRQGQTVQKGQRIGDVGSTGWSTGPHLHFEFLVNGVHTDPGKVIRQAQSVPIPPSAMANFKHTVGQAQAQLLAASQMRESNMQ